MQMFLVIATGMRNALKDDLPTAVRIISIFTTQSVVRASVALASLELCFSNLNESHEGLVKMQTQ